MRYAIVQSFAPAVHWKYRVSGFKWACSQRLGRAESGSKQFAWDCARTGRHVIRWRGNIAWLRGKGRYILGNGRDKVSCYETFFLVEPCIIYSHGMIIRPLPIVSSVISSHTHVGVEVLSTRGNIYEIAHAHCDGKIFTSILAELCRAKRACGAPWVKKYDKLPIRENFLIT